MVSTELTRAGASKPPSPWTPSRLQRSSLAHSNLQILTSTTFPGFLSRTLLGSRLTEWEAGTARRALLQAYSPSRLLALGLPAGSTAGGPATDVAKRKDAVEKLSTARTAGGSLRISMFFRFGE